MTKMTKAQLVEENIALRHNNEILRTQLADVNARLQVLSTQALSTKQAAPAPQAQAQYTERSINTYTKRDGSRWGVYQTAPNRRVHRPLAAQH